MPGASPPACRIAIREPGGTSVGATWAMPWNTRTISVNDEPRAAIAPS
jgi:hypothetical protein